MKNCYSDYYTKPASTFFPDARGADCWNAVVNMKVQRWCVATKETGPGGIRLDDEGTKSLLGLLQPRLAPLTGYRF